MTTGELLMIDSTELQFPFELSKQMSCSLQLSNKTEDCVAFKMKTTSPKKYCVRPVIGIILPHSTCNVLVKMQAQLEAPRDMQCTDKFLVQSVLTSASASLKDITPEMFVKDSGKKLDEIKLRVVYIAPPQSSSQVSKESEEGSSPNASEMENKTLSTRESLNASMENLKPQESSSQELMRQGVSSKQLGGFCLVFVLAVTLLATLLGYLVKT